MLQQDVSGHSQVIMAYAILNQAWPTILGLPWMQQNDVTIFPARQSLYIGKSDISVQNPASALLSGHLGKLTRTPLPF